MRTLDTHYYVSDDGYVNAMIKERVFGKYKYSSAIYRGKKIVYVYEFDSDELFDEIDYALAYIRGYEKGETK